MTAAQVPQAREESSGDESSTPPPGGGDPSNLVDPTTVKFSQRGVSARFGKKGATIEDTVAGINAGNIDPNDFPPIRLVERDGDLYTLDSCRIVKFKKEGLPEAPYVFASPAR